MDDLASNKGGSEVHQKPPLSIQIKSRMRKRVILSLFFLVIFLSALYRCFRKQTIEEAMLIIGTGRKAKTDLEGQVLVENAIRNGKIGREVINFDNGNLDRMIKENSRKNRVEEEVEGKMVFHEKSSILESITVFAFARPDLVRYHLESVDSDVKQVFVVLNTFSIAVTLEMKRLLKLFDCSHSRLGLKRKYQNSSGEFDCINPCIRKLTILESGNRNVGFAGSFNIAAKKMLQNNIQYTIISNDDTRFRPGSLKNIGKLFAAKPKSCLLLFSHFSSFGITISALRRIGVMDEHFWPAYSEDTDYYLRSVLGNCENFHASDRYDRLLVSHGENPHALEKSATLKSGGERYKRMIKNTKNKMHGRDAYLCRKWGGDCPKGWSFKNSNKAFHAVLQRYHEEHEFISFRERFVPFGENIFRYPFNDSNLHISWWNNGKYAGSVASPRSVNKEYAPPNFVWKMSDWSLIS